MITMKFGGTSVQDAEAITNVIGIVRSSLPRKPVVVISAIAQGTNTLEKIGRSAGAGNITVAKEEIDGLLRRHITIVNRLIKREDLKKDLAEFIAQSGITLHTLASGLDKLRELTPRTMDAFYSFGELLSSRIVAAGLTDAGIPAQWLDARDFLVTDDVYGRARPVMHVVEERLTKIVPPLLAAGKVPVTQGFIGVTVSGHRTTMGRESSDYTGSLIGSALDAEAIEIWTDVTGVLTADPRVVENPRQVKHLTFAEAYELTYFGAKVLHPGTMHPAEAKQIPIDILNSKEPGAGGTRVSIAAPGGKPAVKSVTFRKDLSLLTLTPLHRHGQYIFWEHLFGVLTERRAEALLMNTAEYRTALVMKSVDAVDDVREALKDVCLAEIRHSKALVCAVGENIARINGLPERFIRSIGDQPVHFLSAGPSPNALAAVIESDTVEETVRRAHNEFFGDAGPR
jgi:aspartate kinase